MSYRNYDSRPVVNVQRGGIGFGGALVLVLIILTITGYISLTSWLYLGLAIVVFVAALFIGAGFLGLVRGIALALRRRRLLKQQHADLMARLRTGALVLLVALSLGACKKKDGTSTGYSGEPPPLAQGNCRIEVYADGQGNPNTRSCVFEGYVWSCHGRTCTRGAQATGEDVR